MILFLCVLIPVLGVAIGGLVATEARFLRDELPRRWR